jgi:hypothetical protein
MAIGIDVGGHRAELGAGEALAPGPAAARTNSSSGLAPYAAAPGARTWRTACRHGPVYPPAIAAIGMRTCAAAADTAGATAMPLETDLLVAGLVDVRRARRAPRDG